MEKINYLEALLFIANEIGTTHLSVSKAFKGCALYSVEFYGCETKECPSEATLASLSGTGKTIEEACESYFNRIRNKYLVFHAYHSIRHETWFETEFEKYKNYKVEE